MTRFLFISEYMWHIMCECVNISMNICMKICVHRLYLCLNICWRLLEVKYSTAAEVMLFTCEQNVWQLNTLFLSAAFSLENISEYIFAKKIERVFVLGLYFCKSLDSIRAIDLSIVPVHFPNSFSSSTFYKDCWTSSHYFKESIIWLTWETQSHRQIKSKHGQQHNRLLHKNATLHSNLIAV